MVSRHGLVGTKLWGFIASFNIVPLMTWGWLRGHTRLHHSSLYLWWLVAGSEVRRDCIIPHCTLDDLKLAQRSYEIASFLAVLLMIRAGTEVIQDCIIPHCTLDDLRPAQRSYKIGSFLIVSLMTRGWHRGHMRLHYSSLYPWWLEASIEIIQDCIIPHCILDDSRLA